MILIPTSERCPLCDSLVYMVLYQKDVASTKVIADGCYLDQHGVLCVTKYDDNTKEPSYECIFCRWEI